MSIKEKENMAMDKVLGSNASGGKIHYSSRFIRRVTSQTYCNRLVDAEWVTDKIEKVTCLQCLRKVDSVLLESHEFLLWRKKNNV